MNYFTDRELGKKPATINEITISVWNGIVAVFESLKSDNSFSKVFPEQCPDGQGVYGFSISLFQDKLKASVPNIEMPISAKEEFKTTYDWDEDKKEEKNKIDTFAVLDFIEFCFRHLHDSEPIGDLHGFYHHHHLAFKGTEKSKQKFREEINILFERNGIAFHLDIDGKIKKVIPEVFNNVIRMKFHTADTDLNELLIEATQSILLPKTSDRTKAVEKLWDAFERIKTVLNPDNKKDSISQLIKLVANENSALETLLDTEARELTKIANEKLQIRHFEEKTTKITEAEHYDYLFFRMFSLIHLFLGKIEKKS